MHTTGVMNNKRIVYSVATFATIATGLFVRLKKAWFPDIINLYLGDILYAFMMYYIVSCIVVNKDYKARAVVALLICFTIEVSQLYQAEWINAVRQTIPGKLILGSGFLWSDLLAYSIGVSSALIFDKFVVSKAKNSKGNIT